MCFSLTVCVCVLQASRARHSNMAKICNENSFLNRQRLPANTPDEELAVIENGDSRSDLKLCLKSQCVLLLCQDVDYFSTISVPFVLFSKCFNRS